MSINKYSNIRQEDVCIWFKNHLEGHSRIELMCSLLDICLPLELRFLGTYLEYVAGKHHAHLQKWEKDANNPTSFLINNLADTTTRRRLCLFLTLLHSHNKTIATKLFDVLSLYENLASLIQTSSTSSSTQVDQLNDEKQIQPDSIPEYDTTSWNEFKLLLTLSSLHPAFSFSQRLIIREKLNHFIVMSQCNSKLGTEKASESTEKSDEKFEDHQVSSDAAHQLIQPAVPENALLLINDGSNAGTLSIPTAISIPGNAQKQGLLPTPMLHIQELHYPHYIPVQGNFSAHPGQPILIPSSSLSLLNQQEQILCVQSTPNIPININNTRYSQNVSFHKANTKSKNSSDGSNVLPHTLPTQQDVLHNSHFSSFHQDANLSSKRGVGSDMSERDVRIKQPVLMPNHISPFQVINNNFHHHNKLPPSGEMHSNWGSISMSDKQNDVTNSQQKRRADRSACGSVSDVKGSTPDLDLPPRRPFSETDTCETTSINNTHVPFPSRPVVCDSTAIPPIIHHNINVSDYTMSYKSKVIGSPYTHISDQSLLVSNQSRAILLPKGLSDINTIPGMHPNTSQIMPSLNFQKINEIADHTISHCNLSTVITSVLTVAYSSEESIVSSVRKLHSPQVYISSDKQTMPTGINGGYLQNPVNADTFHTGTNVSVSDNHPRVASSLNHLSAGSNLHNISPISIQVHRKSSQAVNTNNNHILSPCSGGGKYSSDGFESPATSPAHSPRRSPYSSPSNSPMSHRKDYSNMKHIDPFSSASNWLKSLRLHKYSHKFEGYTFQMMKDLTDECLAELISTKGAQSKFKQNVELLVKRGFTEFGCGEYALVEEGISSLINHAVSPPGASHVNKVKTLNPTQTNDAQSFLLSPVLNAHLDVAPPHGYEGMHNVYHSENNETQNTTKGKVQEVSPLIRQSGFFEEMNGRLVNEPYADDDTYEEVLTSRKAHSSLPTCYNCGAKGHYGHQCIEETMEAQTYSRYAFQLDFSRRDSFANTEPKGGNASIISR